MKLLMLRGLSASGKSTFAKELVAKDPTWVRTNKDSIREMIHAGVWSQDREKTVLLMENAMIEAALKDKKNVVVDNTHLAPKHENRLRQTAANLGAEFEIKDFYATVEECIKRDLKRPNPVGEAVIRQQHRDYIRPKMKIEQDKQKRRSWIVDLDGTLALLNGRNPYDASGCINDLPNYPVRTAVKAIANAGHAIIAMSGRQNTHYKETMDWLDKHGIDVEALIMREAGDMRKDSVVKKELLQKNVLPYYYVVGVIDDRRQVVDMYRDLGFTVLQVADGEF